MKKDLKVRYITAPNREELAEVEKGRVRRIEVVMNPDNECECIEMEEPDADGNRYVVTDGEGNAIPIRYDAACFHLGDPRAEHVIVEITEISTEMLYDENDEPIIMEEYGDDYYAEQVNYTLGKVIESSVLKVVNQ